MFLDQRHGDAFENGTSDIGAPGRTRTRGPRFRKPMTHHSDSPTKSANTGSRPTSSFFVFPPICVNLPQFVPIIVTNWSQIGHKICPLYSSQKHQDRWVWFESCAGPRTLHNTNQPEIIIKGPVINLSRDQKSQKTNVRRKKNAKTK